MIARLLDAVDPRVQDFLAPRLREGLQATVEAIERGEVTRESPAKSRSATMTCGRHDIPGARQLASGVLPWGVGAAVAACVLNAVWLACMITLESRGDVALQAGTSPGLFRVSVGSALLITIVQVPILLSMASLAAERDVARASIGGVFYALYLPVNLVGYFSYGRLAPMAYSPSLTALPEARVVADLVEIGRPLGLTGNLPLLGYALLGLAWCLLSSMLRRRGRLWKVAAPLLFVSGFLSVLGGIGAFTDVGWLTACCFLGGVVSLPALGLLAAALWRDPVGRAPDAEVQ